MDKPIMDMQDRAIVISGGTKGLGRAVALECAKRGARVLIGGRDESAAEQILDEISSLGGHEAHFVSTDLKQVDQCKRLFDETAQRFGRLDGYFHYAGITPAAPLLEIDEEHFDLVFQINTRAALFCCRYAVQMMKDGDGGSIVLTGSPHAWGGEKDRIVYACSKGALLTLTRHIAEHYAEFGVRANLLTMGWTPTDGELELRTRQNISVEELNEMAAEVIPAGRMTQIDDQVPGIVYLLSDHSKMVSGSNLRITGGWFL
ncbi:MAG: SDR family oxidoreductase [Planctomycetota bacterium]